MNEALERARQALRLGPAADRKGLVAEIPLPDILEIWDELEEEERLALFTALDAERRVDLITSIPTSGQEELITQLTRENLSTLLERMDPDDLTDVIQAVSPEVREAVWNALSDEARRETQFLLKFDSDDAAGIMNPRYLAIRATLTVAQAIAWVRRSAGEVETVYYIYVLDRLQRLVGVVSLRDILAARDEQLIEEIAVKKVITVYDDTDQEEAARILQAYDLLALPVVDRHNRLLGIVTFDDIIDVIAEEQTEDLYKMSSMGGSTEPYLEYSTLDLVRKRIPWLIVLLLTATITSNVIAHYQAVLQVAVVLAFFIPLVTGTGGNTGTQSATLIIRGLATGELGYWDLPRILGKEVLVGTLIGVALGALTIARSLFLPPLVTGREALAVGVAMTFVVLVANLVGALAPILIARLGRDPAFMAGPLMATLIDVTGLTIYFEVARLLLKAV